MKPTKPTSFSSAASGVRNDAKQTDTQAITDEVSLSDDADTIRLVALEHNDKLSIEEDTGTVNTPFDPYNRTSAMSQDNKPRRSIDDMRKLSAEISKTKHYSRKG